MTSPGEHRHGGTYGDLSGDQPADHLLNDEVSYEATDVRAGSIVAMGIALLITLFISMAIVWATFDSMKRERLANQALISPLRVGMGPEVPPAPLLQGEPGSPMLGPQDLAAVLASANARLDSAGWVDQSAGIRRIPIQQAMDIIAARGLPDVHPTSTAAAVAAATAKAEATARKAPASKAGRAAPR